VGFADTDGVGVGLAVRLGVGDAATTRGDGRDAGELTTSALAGALLAALSGLTTAAAEPWEAEIAPLEVAGDATCEIDPAADG
jgi:hypothetical protein